MERRIEMRAQGSHRTHPPLMLLLSTTVTALLVPVAPPRCARCAPPVALFADDPLDLAEISRELQNSFKLGDTAPDETSGKLLTVHSSSVAPLVPTIYTPDVPEIERKTAIEDISRALDLMEEAAQGPLLAGSKLSLADAVAYPSIALCSLTLPDHFGWEPWTEESMFYRRPRLHAWYELISYEKACREAEKQIRAKLEEVADLAKIAVDVPTSKLRDFPKHAM